MVIGLAQIFNHSYPATPATDGGVSKFLTDTYLLNVHDILYYKFITMKCY